MLRTENFVKGDNYYSLTFAEGMNAYGFLMIQFGDEPAHVEFMKFADNGKDIITITEKENFNEFTKLQAKYLNPILSYIDKHGK
jgi:hypothetical protein